MKLALKLTLDGLLRALRARAHRLAEEIEAGRVPRPERSPRLRPQWRRPRAVERDDDGGRGD